MTAAPPRENLEDIQIRISDSMEQWKELVTALPMKETQSWQGFSHSYGIDGFYIEWEDYSQTLSTMSMKNEECDYVTMFGVSLGDTAEYADSKLTDDGWFNFFQKDNTYEYLIICEEIPYYFEFKTDDTECVCFCYWNNWPQGEDIAEFLNGNRQDDKTISIFESMTQQFIFSSGAGAWSTVITIEKDGSFTGQYHDSDMGDTGDGYSGGTVYICNFSGKFSEPEQLDTYTYSMQLESLNVEGTAGEIYYENNIKYVYSNPYGFNDADEFVIYSPGIRIDDLPQGFVSWLRTFVNVQTTEVLPVYGIYNINADAGFIESN